jgi:hypothetical protein
VNCRKIKPGLIVALAVAGVVLLACGGDSGERSGGGFYGDEAHVRLDCGGGGVVGADLPVYADPKDDVPAVVLNKGEFAFLAAVYDSAAHTRRIYYGERLDEGEPETGWVKDVTAEQFSLYCYTVSEDATVYKKPGDSNPITVLGLGDRLTVYNEAKKVGDTTWVKVGEGAVKGWVRLEDVAYGDVAFSKNAYTYSKKGESKKVIECLGKAEMSGAFVDYGNRNGPWAARVPGTLFRVFGAGLDVEMKVTGGGPVAVDPHGRYLAYATDENGVSTLNVVDLKETRTIFEADYVDDFKWSPLGQFLAYREGIEGIYSLQFFWTERGTSIASARLAGEYEWSPDGYLLGFTGARENESVEFYVEPTDRLPDDDLLTTVEIYDPFALLGGVILESDAAKKYEFAGWESGSVLDVRVTDGEVGVDGALRYIGKPSTTNVPFSRGQLHPGGHRYWKELEVKLGDKLKGTSGSIPEWKPSKTEPEGRTDEGK